MTRLMVLAFASATVAGSAFATRDNRDFMSRHYPVTALARGEEGRVGFRVELNREGQIEQCAITESSGFVALDRETCDFIVQYAGFEAARDSEGRGQPAVKTGVINWKLPAGVRKTATAPQAASMKLPPPLICKPIQMTGSNVAKARHCMTESEWQLQEQVMRDKIDALQGHVFCGDHPGCQ